MSRAGCATRPIQPVAEGQKWCVGFLATPGHASPLANFTADRRQIDERSRKCRDCARAERKPKIPGLRRAPRNYASGDKPFPPGTDIYVGKRRQGAPETCLLCSKPGVIDRDGHRLCVGKGSHTELAEQIVLRAGIRRVA